MERALLIHNYKYLDLFFNPGEFISLKEQHENFFFSNTLFNEIIGLLEDKKFSGLYLGNEFCENLIQGNRFPEHDAAKNIKISLHYPYFYMTTGRYCLFYNIGKKILIHQNYSLKWVVNRSAGYIFKTYPGN